MARRLKDWINGFMDYASFGEAPKHVYFFVACSTLAGALRRKVWIDQKHFQWFPNLYVVLVAPPGIISKSTTADIGMSLLRQVPNIRFGPAVITWQALVQSFAAAAESFDIGGEWHTMSPMTISSSEFGNLLNPHDKDMVDMLVNLWDGRSFDKKTKHSGDDKVTNPWINLIACTTPDWIAGSFPEYMIGGGFTSRCLWIYAEKKEQYIAYPALHAPADLEAKAEALVHDLEWISSNMSGPFAMTREAIEWGTAWYEEHYKIEAAKFDPSRYGGYVARKQTHMHKLAMILSASESDEMLITDEHLRAANNMLATMEGDMPKVFDRIGSDPASVHYERLVRMVTVAGALPASSVFRVLGKHFPKASDLQGLIETAVRSGVLIAEQRPKGDGTYDAWLIAREE